MDTTTYSSTPTTQEIVMTGTAKNAEGQTTHRCTSCGLRFVGTQKRGRPSKKCPECRAK